MTATITALGIALFQDTGRHGHAADGVPGSGPADRSAYDDANWLVEDTAQTVIELLGAFRMVADSPLMVAYTGAETDVTINGRQAPARSTLHLLAGDTLTIGAARAGVYGYLATPGGWDTDSVLGSTSTDTLSGLGPNPLTGGSVLTASGDTTSPRACRGGVATATVAVMAGPHAALLGQDTFDALTSTVWAIGAGSSRAGLRLTGSPIEHEAPTLTSLPVLDGAIQLTPSGQPIALGPDHGTAGGYPILGMITRQGLDTLYRLRQGETFTFTHRPLAVDTATRYELATV